MQKKGPPGSLATPQAWLPSRERFFRRGQKLARGSPVKLFVWNFTIPVFEALPWESGAQTACPLFPKKSFAFGGAATGRVAGDVLNAREIPYTGIIRLEYPQDEGQ
jgi:hypothetical protein